MSGQFKTFNIKRHEMNRNTEKQSVHRFGISGTYIMKISEEIQQMLDDHIVLTQQISFSPFKGPFDDDIDEWEEKLRITAEVIDEWMDVQK